MEPKQSTDETSGTRWAQIDFLMEYPSSFLILQSTQESALQLDIYKELLVLLMTAIGDLFRKLKSKLWVNQTS